MNVDMIWMASTKMVMIKKALISLIGTFLKFTSTLEQSLTNQVTTEKASTKMVLEEVWVMGMKRNIVVRNPDIGHIVVRHLDIGIRTIR